MKKYRIWIIFLFFIEIIICQSSNNSCKGSADSIKDCEDLLTEEEEMENKHCCFFTGSTNDYDTSQCILLDNDAYKDLENTKINLITQDGYSNVDIDCESCYGQLNYFFVIIFILAYFNF